MRNYYLKSVLLLFLFFTTNANAQVEEIKLSNPSFEDFPRPSHQPRGWYDCGDINFPLETAPDTHPSEMINGKPLYGVTQKPYDGNTYLGLVYRETGTYESVAQKLKSKLLIGNIYSFTISLCTSDIYNSAIRGGGSFEEIDFTTPVYLRIWGGVGYCDTRELLAQSPLIENTDWRDFTFFLEPNDDDLSYIILEIGSDEPVNGNLLVDNASSIQIEDMNTEELSLIRTQNKQGNDSLGIAIKTKRLAEREITIKGTSIKFKDNQLSVSGKRKIRSVVKAMRDLPNHKLIFDFNGLRKKKAKPRSEAIVNTLLEENLSEEFFEIRNSTEEDNKVKWLVDDKNMFIGILEIK